MPEKNPTADSGLWISLESAERGVQSGINCSLQRHFLNRYVFDWETQIRSWEKNFDKEQFRRERQNDWTLLDESEDPQHRKIIDRVVEESSRHELREFRRDLPMLGTEEIENRLGFHKATIEGTNATLPKHSQLRRLFRLVGLELDEVLPDGRAKDVAFIELENASMWAHKAVAENAPLVPEQFEDQQKTDREDQREQQMRDILKKMMLDEAKAHQHMPDESDRDFLARMVRAGVTSIESFDAVYKQ